VTETDHDRLRELTAAYVIGALDPADRAELDRHLQDCDECRADVVAFAPLPALLGRVEPHEVDSPLPVGGADALVAAVLDDGRRLRGSRQRWRWLAGAAAVVAIALGLATVQDEDAPTRRGEGVVLAVELAGADATAEVVADRRAWGTYVHLSAAGLPDRDVYRVWTVDRTGAWEPVGSWGPTAGGRAQLGSSTSLDLEEIDRIVVTSERRDEELLVAR
jgi:anti-sigma-K factor RskA